MIVLGPREVSRFRAAITAIFGLQFDDSKLGFLAGVLQERLDRTGMKPADYLLRLESTDRPKEELHALAAAVTVAETYFFRNIDQFHALRELILPERLAARGPFSKVKILSAACASGEEAYSLAIIARDRAEITAVDVNPVMLERAAKGRYSAWSLREAPPELVNGWFARDRADYVLDASIRSSVDFQEKNLVTAGAELWRPSTYDVVFCRNVLMYFMPETAARVVEKIAEALVPEGYLFLGHAETLRGLSHDFHLKHTHGTFYYQKKQHPSREYFPEPSSPVFTAVLDFATDTSWIELVQKSAERIHALAERSRPAPSVLPQVELGAALELLKGERFAEALDFLEGLPTDDETLLLRAVALTHLGRLPAAEEVCRELLAHDELHAGAYYLLALCREGRGDRQGAIEHDQTATYLDPAFAMPHLHLGLLARRGGERERAREALDHALLLLQREDPSRLLLFGGGFSREALIALCRAELSRAGSER